MLVIWFSIWFCHARKCPLRWPTRACRKFAASWRVGLKQLWMLGWSSVSAQGLILFCCPVAEHVCLYLCGISWHVIVYVYIAGCSGGVALRLGMFWWESTLRAGLVFTKGAVLTLCLSLPLFLAFYQCLNSILYFKAVTNDQTRNMFGPTCQFAAEFLYTSFHIVLFIKASRYFLRSADATREIWEIFLNITRKCDYVCWTVGWHLHNRRRRHFVFRSHDNRPDPALRIFHLNKSQPMDKS